MPPVWDQYEKYVSGERVTIDGFDYQAQRASVGVLPPAWPWVALATAGELATGMADFAVPEGETVEVEVPIICVQDGSEELSAGSWMLSGRVSLWVDEVPAPLTGLFSSNFVVSDTPAVGDLLNVLGEVVGTGTETLQFPISGIARQSAAWVPVFSLANDLDEDVVGTINLFAFGGTYP